jgi:hypothetical protein
MAPGLAKAFINPGDGGGNKAADVKFGTPDTMGPSNELDIEFDDPFSGIIPG